MSSHHNKPYSLFFFSVLVFSLFFSVSFSDQDSDREALLSFKADSDPSSISLPTWLNSSEPCSGRWLGVTCDSATGRVTGLVLESLGLAGSVKSLSQLGELRHLSLKNNSLQSEPGSSMNLSSWPNLKHLYLSRNRFSGSFPVGISSLRRVQRLDFSHNQFSGKIPATELSRLPRLLTLRLESNGFDGGLDESAPVVPSPISDFNVSNNNLSGKIPNWLRRFDAASFLKNDRLCGKPLPYECLNTTDHRESPIKKKKNDTKLSIVVLAVVAVVAAITVVLVSVLFLRRKRITWRSREIKGESGIVVLEGCGKGFGDVAELLRGSAEMLGKGSVGTTFKVAVAGGDYDVAVKRVNVSDGKEVDWWWLRHVLGELRHANIAGLRAYHRSHHLLLLVYDYFPRGSLHNLLHGNRGPGRTPVGWATRLKLASDAARGLSFLHHHRHGKKRLFHGHVSSENILLDHQGNAYVADAGLHQLVGGSDKYRHGQKGDMYGFGVVLMEMLTGNVGPTTKWSGWESLDVEVLRSKETEGEISALLQVAALCLAPSPKDRPSMSAVYGMVENIRTKGVERPAGSVMDDVLGGSSSSSSSSSSFSSKRMKNFSIEATLRV